MDIIASHQQGLIEQLDAEVEALAGRPGDHAQRAIVLHHLYEHSNGGHVWALAEARRSLRIASALTRLERRLSRWPWTVRNAAAARLALIDLSDALGEAARRRMVGAYRAYRLSATEALRGEAEAILPPALLQALDECHSARRESFPIGAQAVSKLAEESQCLAEDQADSERLETVWAAVEASGLGRSAIRLLGDRALARFSARDERKGRDHVEQLLRADPLLPASFRANPAQHFYALQRLLTERRRQQWRELCDVEADAVALAA
jgi:hypothetical protein